MLPKILSSLLLLLISTITLASPTLTEETQYYDIHGTTSQALRHEMNGLGPIDGNTRVDAQTTWNITWRYDYSYNSTSCSLTNIQVSAKITYLFPKWAEYNIADAALRYRWDNYLVNLRTHEYGHAENGRNAAVEIEQALWETPTMSNCDALGTVANDKAMQIIKNHNNWDKQYDEITQHGFTQGAFFP